MLKVYIFCGDCLSMPELPEVETVVRQLQPLITGKKIISIQNLDRKILDKNVQNAVSHTITAVHRRGKYIVMDLENNHSLLTHLRMTGSFSYTPKRTNKQPLPYHRGTFQFQDGSQLQYHCMRRFSRITFLSQPQLQSAFSSLGPEVLDITFTQFQAQLSHYPKSQIKPKLMDQCVLAGVGNIYAQEALYHAGILPQRTIGTLSGKEWQTLHAELRKVLLLSIKNNGTTIKDYAHITGKGDFQHLLMVYQQERCPRNHPVRYEKVGGRGTYHCVKCQR